MQKRTLARHAFGTGWAHPYATGPFDPYLYADGGDGDGSGSDNADGDDGGDDDDGQDDDAGGTDDDAEDDDSEDDDKDTGDGKPKPKPPAKKAAAPSRRDKELEKARDQAAKARVAAKEAGDKARAELIQGIGKALGLVEDDKDAAPDPAKLTAEIERTQKAHREAVVELAVYRGASKYGADPDALTDSRKFLKSIADLDPSDEGFTKAVASAIKSAVSDDPKLKAASQAPARNSGDFSGSTEKPKNQNSIEAQREARRKARS